MEWDSTFSKPLKATHGLAEPARRQALDMARGMLAPCGAGFAGNVVARLKAVLAGQSKSEADLRAWAAVMIQELAALPNDLVSLAYEKWIRGEKWLPTPAEFMDRMEPELSTRRKVADALSKPADVVEPQHRERADPARIDEILTKHGHTPSKPTGVSA